MEMDNVSNLKHSRLESSESLNQSVFGNTERKSSGRSKDCLTKKSLVFFLITLFLLIIIGYAVSIYISSKANSDSNKIQNLMVNLSQITSRLEGIKSNTLKLNMTRKELLMLNTSSKEKFSSQKTSIDMIRQKLGNINNSVEEIRANQNAPATTSIPRCASENTTCETCPSTSFNFPRVDQTIDYVRYTGSIPALDEFTACMWLETDDYVDNRDTIFSYAVPNRHNELWIFFENANDIGLGLYSSSAEAIILSHPTFVGNVTVHICIWFSTILQRAGLYLNGTLTSSQHTSKPSLQRGGTLILGQDQDNVGGGFSATQSYHGNITNVMIWPRVLSSQEISNVARRCVCPSDYVVAVTSQSVNVVGQVTQSIPLRCPMV